MMKIDNTVTIVLASACGVLLLLAGLFASGWNGDISPIDPAEPRPIKIDDLGDGSNFDLGDVDDYQAIGDRPLFAESRRPPPEVEVVIDDSDDNEVPSLEVAIGGIIINGETKIALLTDKNTNTPMRVKEGANLEGDLADWVLASVEPRKLSFDGGSAGQVDLELEVSDRTIAAPAKPPPSTPVASAAAPNAQSGGDADADRAARAEEIRRRVAERREQLREEAARRRAERELDEEDG